MVSFIDEDPTQLKHGGTKEKRKRKKKGPMKKGPSTRGKKRGKKEEKKEGKQNKRKHSTRFRAALHATEVQKKEKGKKSTGWTWRNDY